MRIAALALLFLAGLTSAFADGRADWSGYDWRGTPFGQCLEITPAGCLAHHAKWDWKRNQWVDVWYDPAANGLHLALRLTNNDRADADYVCVTVLFLDAAGANLAAYHSNLHIGPQSIREDKARLTIPAPDRIARVEIGSKQCREGAGQDDDIYAGVRARLPR